MGKLLTQSEAAEYLQISPRTLEAWRVRGGGPLFLKVGKRSVRYRQADLEAFTAKLMRNTGDTAGTAAQQ